MNFEEYAAKPLLAKSGLAIPPARLVADSGAAFAAAQAIGPCVVKAQVPTGKRGKAGGIKLAATPDEAKAHAKAILGMEIGGFTVEKLLIEGQVPIARELYAAVLNDPKTRGPMVLFSTMGGMDVEEATEKDPTAMRRLPVDITKGLARDDALSLLDGLDLSGATDKIADALVALYKAYRKYDADLLEINPLVVTDNGNVVALDCKFVLDDSSAGRHQGLAEFAAAEPQTELEEAAQKAGLRYIELGGSVGVLANGAGLTMTTMDAVTHYGGEPANFLEVGGEAYTKAKDALSILLANPNLRSLLVNFCGAFARTDVMAEGVVNAWKDLDPKIPVFFTIHGTGEDEAIALVKKELGIEPFDLMDDAVRAAVAAAKEKAA
ncbi:succinyl-CoA synthetase beta subunit [Rhodobium orientis]|uniref:Succinate--CoA ligase n=1 Tax=Rhodobium orientis TaxID=34017 RepID=A0A327JW36_9HYPH|nr:ATP-grasp domain-containing protein [Rhodobium orientis]MBB4302745.1 succinyl-CoA synthetase beta subunit [Rhodobium orientis]MBK5948526.1 succinate--CoA ligase [Rhodobium orientis]RAI29795.1 succinate--CoA ligase [Rhodobium orientis]